MNKIKYLAIYLPQFHEIEENNIWWGKGFTEWTNTKKATPLFNGHYQPRTPLNENYYDLSNTEYMRVQAKMAQEYGIYGFCYYHYWFKDGKKLLEKPLENMLEDECVDIPFVLSWANEPWSRRWDGSENQVLMKQEYGDQNDWEQHFQYLLPFFQDKRYICENNQPLFLIYKPDEIPSLAEMTTFFNERAKVYGFTGIKFIYQFPTYHFSGKSKENIIDTGIQFEPIYTIDEINSSKYLLKNIVKNPSFVFNNISRRLKLKFKIKGQLNIVNYDTLWKSILSRKVENSSDFYPGAFVDWDNSARRGEAARIILGSTPEKFGDYLDKLTNKTIFEYNKDFIFINAWNEWAEGAYLEPDEKYGYQYLEQVKKCYDKYNGGN